MKSAQEWVFWLEAGAGARWLRRAAFVALALVLSLVTGYKQFRGARSEVTLAQADLGWQLGTGQGFTTRIKYPQTAAWLAARHESLDGRAAFPALAEPPLYPLVIGGAVAVLPAARRTALFASAGDPPEGFGGDCLLLAVNLLLFWLAAALTYNLARRLFDVRVAVVAVLALMLSSGAWASTVAVNGTPLLMVLLLLLAGALLRADEARSGGGVRAWLAAAGAAAGLMFLTDYPAGTAALVVLGFVAVRWRGAARGWGLLAVVAAFTVVTGPWLVRNVALTGSPVGLAWQDLALRAGDPTAEPATIRATLSAATPAISLAKLGNKGLTAVQTALGAGLWSGGGLCCTAFFVAGLLYRFRQDSVRRLRVVTVALVGVLVVAHAFLNTGEGERLPAAYAAPLLIVFGAGFFSVLVASHEWWSARWGWAAAALLLLQGAPLAREALEPGRLHFSYPPYYPRVFADWIRRPTAQHGFTGTVWMADVPAGLVWYTGLSAWAQPADLADFYALSDALHDRPLALLLTPRTLDRPFWGELTADRRKPDPYRGNWAQIYGGLVTGRFPPLFRLSQPVQLAGNLVLLRDPAWGPPQ